MSIENKLKELNIILPEAPAPVGSYVAFKIVGKSLEKMRGFSEKNKTIDQSFKNIKEKLKKD